MTSRVSSAVGLIITFVILALTCPHALAGTVGPCAGDATCSGDVGSDQQTGSFVGRGGMVLPASSDLPSMSREQAAGCQSCAWRLQSVCPYASGDDICVGATLGCPPGEIRRALLRQLDPSAGWEFVGTLCVGGRSRPVLVADVADRVRDRFVDLLPPPHPSYQPANGALVNLPAIFASGQRDGVQRDDFVLFDLPVHVDARPSWDWAFGDGATLTTADAGGTYPDRRVSHTFTHAGQFTVSVDSSWTGTFTVDGLGPFDVTGGPVTQAATLAVTVREAGGQLVAN